MKARCALLLVLVLCFAEGRAAQAESRADRKAKAKAAALYKKAKALYTVANFKAAAAEYEKAHTVYPDPAFIYNIAQCVHQIGDTERAIFLYKSFLREAKDSRFEKMRLQVAERVRKMEELEAAKATGRVVSPEQAAAVSPDAPLPLASVKPAQEGAPTDAVAQPPVAVESPASSSPSRIAGSVAPAAEEAVAAPPVEPPPAPPPVVETPPPAPVVASTPPPAPVAVAAPPPPPPPPPPAPVLVPITPAPVAQAKPAEEPEGGGVGPWLWLLFSAVIVGGATGYYYKVVREPALPASTLGNTDALRH